LSNPIDILQIIHIEEKDVIRWMETKKTEADTLMRHFKLTKNCALLHSCKHNRPITAGSIGSRGGSISSGGGLTRRTTTTPSAATTIKPARTVSRAVSIDATVNTLQDLWKSTLKQQPKMASQLLKILKKRHIIGVGQTGHMRT
jgi:hypothetical protein